LDKIKNCWVSHRPTKRRFIQLYAALLYNCQFKGFGNGKIYVGPLKNVCVPGINCYSCPGAVGSCPLGAFQNAIAASGARFPAYILGTLAMFGILLGRVVCGFLCPLGLIQELLVKIPVPKIKKNKLTRLLSYLKYVILVVFAIAIPIYYATKEIPVPGFCKYICPAGTLEGAMGLLSNPANYGQLARLNIYFTRKFIILVLFIVLAMFMYRWFCRFLCPLGAIYGFFNRIAMLGMQVDDDKCNHCGMCVANCKMDVCRVGDHECIQCGECKKHCHQGAICRKTLFAGKKEIYETPEGNGNLKRQIIAWSVAVVVLIACIWYVNFTDSTGSIGGGVEISESGNIIGAKPGEEMADFTVPMIGSDESFTLSDYRGKVTIINYWATSCGPCCKELPYFQKVYEEYGDQVNIIAIHTKDVTDDIEEFVANQGYTMLVGFDADGKAFAAADGSNLIPQTVVLDENGLIVYNICDSVTYEKLVAMIEEVR